MSDADIPDKLGPAARWAIAGIFLFVFALGISDSYQHRHLVDGVVYTVLFIVTFVVAVKWKPMARFFAASGKWRRPVGIGLVIVGVLCVSIGVYLLASRGEGSWPGDVARTAQASPSLAASQLQPAPQPRPLTQYEIQTNQETVDLFLKAISEKVRPSVLRIGTLVQQADQHTPRQISNEDTTVYEKQLREAGDAYASSRREFADMSQLHGHAAVIMGQLNGSLNPGLAHLVWEFGALYSLAAQRAQSGVEFKTLMQPSQRAVLEGVEKAKAWLDTSVNKLLEIRQRTTAPQ